MAWTPEVRLRMAVEELQTPEVRLQMAVEELQTPWEACR
jgi:hypothetical protein